MLHVTGPEEVVAGVCQDAESRPLRFCACGAELRSRQRFCSQACKQAAYRLSEKGKRAAVKQNEREKELARIHRLEQAERRARGRIDFRFQFQAAEVAAV